MQRKDLNAALAASNRYESAMRTLSRLDGGELALTLTANGQTDKITMTQEAREQIADRVRTDCRRDAQSALAVLKGMGVEE